MLRICAFPVPRVMIVSLNEVEVNLRKAAVGAGLPLGLCEDLGRAAAWLAASGLPAVPASLAALDNLLGARSAAAVFSRDDQENWHVTSEEPAAMVSAIHAGPPACDLLRVSGQEGKGVSRIRLSGVDCPLLILATTAVLTAQSGFRVKLSLMTGKALTLFAVCGGGDADLYLDPNRLDASSDMILERVSGSVGPSETPLVGRGYLAGRRRAAPGQGVRVVDEDWERVLELAARTLVPASELSRRQGAGAGLRDND